MALSKAAQATADLTSAYDVRQRLFDRLRDLNLDDEKRAEAVADYVAAAKAFDDLRTKIAKP